MWKPADSSREIVEARSSWISNDDIARITAVTTRAWAVSTATLYGSGLLVFHVFCDERGIPEKDRAPISDDVLQLFLATLAGSYAKSSIVNYYAGIRAWHAVHRINWMIDKDRSALLIRGAENLVPASSKREPREPYTKEIVTVIIGELTLGNSFDTAVRACMLVLLWGIARTGECTTKTEKHSDFNPSTQVRRCNVRDEMDPRRELKVKVIHIPSTKADQQQGEDISFARHPGPLCPVTALEEHFRVNNPAEGEHLFAYTKQRTNKRVALSRTAFLKRIRSAAVTAKQPLLSGHAFRIGGTLEYLLQGVPFEVVKALGRWKSDAFQLYLRRHAQILAPYLQDRQELQEELTRLTIAVPPDS
ncbi:hypothetical protein PHLCEN_2v11916 [Hermanssonia centrifuga]|uniref:Tyr recombinase domain-containing protein n=1 Tax=Hermanssonia centrifuga TaxID=98765 RepID=A0A2R6NIM0_9APHY|nr:hypothetical protein PHLCEN_2v11916 [Hermanssonia centrifuga]